MAKAVITAEFPCPVERVWETVTNLGRQGWRSDVERVEVTGERSFVEYSKGGFATTFTVTDWEMYHHWAFNLENENVRGCWSGTFAASAVGCTATFAEEAAPKKAWMRLFAGLYLRKQQRQYLADLRKALKL